MDQYIDTRWWDIRPWMRYGACAGTDYPDLWFPERAGRVDPRVKAAKAICLDCAVRAECLDYALERGEVGIWGMTTDGERRQLRQAS